MTGELESTLLEVGGGIRSSSSSTGAWTRDGPAVVGAGTTADETG
jgi:phosphoribosylformimino-5-aminoimidazole carboxamide ribonucleotide (ProFAR) isomerase